MGPYGGRDAIGLLGQDVEGARVRVPVDEHDALPRPPHEAHQQLEGVVDLPVEEDLLARRLMCLHVVEDPLEALVGRPLVLELPQLHRTDLLEHGGVARDEVPHLDEGIHDSNAYVNCRFAPKHRREHRHALLGKHPWHIAPPRVLFSQLRV